MHLNPVPHRSLCQAIHSISKILLIQVRGYCIYGLSSVPYALYDGGFNTIGSWARKYTFDTGNEADINHLRNRSLIDPQFEISVDTADCKSMV